MKSPELILLIMACIRAKLTGAQWFYNGTQPLLFSNGGGQYPQDSTLAASDAFMNGANFYSFRVQMTSDRNLVVQQSACLDQSTDA